MPLTFRAALCAFAATMAAPLQAETLPVAGVYAAREDGAVGARTLAVMPFSGDIGEELGFALADRLSEIMVEKERWFDVVPAYGDSDAAAHDMAVVRGSARSWIEEVETSPRTETHCIRKDEGKCVERETTIYECSRITVHFSPVVRLVAQDGDILYARPHHDTQAQTLCADDHAVPNPEAMLQQMVTSYVETVRRDLAPVERHSNLRVMEMRKGLTKSERRAFKQALRMTRNDPFAACLVFDELEETRPDHVSVLFNIGLCRESEGALDIARRYYRRALDAAPGKSYPRKGLERIASRVRADAQIARHLGPAEGEEALARGGADDDRTAPSAPPIMSPGVPVTGLR